MAFPRVVPWGNAETGKSYRPHPLWALSFQESFTHPGRVDASHQVIPIPEPAENSAQFFSHLSRRQTIPEVLAPLPSRNKHAK